jgi:hypothetical protein
MAADDTEEEGGPAMTDGDLSAAAPGESRLQSIDSHLTHAHLPRTRASSAAVAPTFGPRDQATSARSAVTREPPAVTRARPDNPPQPAHSQARDLPQAQDRLRRAMRDSRTPATPEVPSPPARPSQALDFTCRTSRKPTCHRTAIHRSTASPSTHPSSSTSPSQNSRLQNSRPQRPRNRTAVAVATLPTATQAQNRITDDGFERARLPAAPQSPSLIEDAEPESLS